MNYYNQFESYQPAATTSTEKMQPWTTENVFNEEEEDALLTYSMNIPEDPPMQLSPESNNQTESMMMVMPRNSHAEDILPRSFQAPETRLPRSFQAPETRLPRSFQVPETKLPRSFQPPEASLPRSFQVQQQMLPPPRPVMQSPPARGSEAIYKMQRQSLRSVPQAELTLHLLGRDINAEPTTYKGTRRVDIRQWTKDGVRTRKGISLPLPCWQNLIAGRDQIQDVVRRMRHAQKTNEVFDLGDDVHVSIKSPLWLVDIRYWYTGKDGEPRPGRCGIALKFPEFNNLMTAAAQIGKSLNSLPADN